MQLYFQVSLVLVSSSGCVKYLAEETNNFATVGSKLPEANGLNFFVNPLLLLNWGIQFSKTWEMIHFLFRRYIISWNVIMP